MKKEYEELLIAQNSSGDALERLNKIIKILRVECPWDKVQTYESLKTCMLEEAYEVVDAIQENDIENLREELGDVMLQVVFHSNLATEDENFTLCDVINDECDKMIRRHPYVFLEEKGKTIDKTLEKWENMKSKEHGELTISSRLNRVPKAMPALMRGNKVLDKALRNNVLWTDIKEALELVNNAGISLQQSETLETGCTLSEEVGNLLLAVVNVSRIMGINPEEALNLSIDKFTKRFESVENEALSTGMNMSDMAREEIDMLWIKAKNNK